MCKDELFEIMLDMKETLGADYLLEEICKGLANDVLEDELRFIDRVYEMQYFKN